MKKKIDWLNHSVSFVVVLSGILLAFQLTQCTDNRKQRRTIENHKKGLLAETYTNEGNLKVTLVQTEASLVKADSLLELLYIGKNFKAINRLSIELLTTGGAYFIKNSYNALVQSGDIRFIKNFEEKTETIILYETYIIVELNDKTGFEYAYNPFFRYVMNNFDLANNTIQKKDVYLSNKFMNLVRGQQYFLKQKIASYKDCQEKIDNYLEFAENAQK